MEAQQSGMADLAARLTKRLADANSNGNLVFSPLSIYAVLALLAAGAGGDTLEEILRVLGVRSRNELEDSVTRLLVGPLKDTSESGGPSVAFAYGVWSDLTRGMKPAYRDAIVGTYKANASVVDFHNDPEHATRQINAWVADATRNLITSAVPGPLHPDTKLVLANAVYLKGQWDLPFYESDTKNRPFYRLDGTAVDVPFMTNNKNHYIAEHDGFKVLKLRYKNSPYTRLHHCMCIFLPDARDGLGSLLDKITSSPGKFLREHLPNLTVKVGQFRVPKFDLSFHSSVTAVLKDLGLRLPFSPEADLSEMLEDNGSNLPFLLQDVIQKAVIEVNEEGTRAAAVTMAFVGGAPCAPCVSRTVDFVADHPFAYFIIEEGSDAVIFAGHVVDPSNGTGRVIPSPAPFKEYTTTKPKFDESTDEMNRRYANLYGPYPAYDPVSPVYDPFHHTYSQTSPAYSPVSPVYRPTSPAYRPVSPAFRPTFPAYRPAYRPTVPLESDWVSPAPYRQAPPLNTKLKDGVCPCRPQEVKEMRNGGLPKATVPQAAETGEGELPLEKKE